MVTKEAHCLGDILVKAFDGTLDVEIAAVVGNYDTLQNLTEKFDIPYHHVSHEGLSREEHEVQLLQAVQQYDPNYVVLAKYMRILTPNFVAAFPHKSLIFITVFYLLLLGQSLISKHLSVALKLLGQPRTLLLMI